MSTQLLADVLRRDRRFRVVDLSTEDDLASVDVQVAVLFCAPEPSPTFDFIRRLRGLRPNTKIVALMDEPQRSEVLEAFRAGVRGIFCRSDSYRTLAKCLIKVHNGHVWASQAQLSLLVEALGQPFPMHLADAKGTPLLSPREEDVVHWVTEGLTNREIAERLQLSEHTVKNYLFRIFEKLGVSTRAELVMYALSHARSFVSEAMRATPDNSHAGPGSSNLCTADACPLAQLRLAQDQGQGGFPGHELAYVRLSVAAALSTAVLNRSTAALRELEGQVSTDRLPSLKGQAEKQARTALEKMPTFDAGGVKPGPRAA